jgi:uncharacterized protein (TIGR02118 family)
VEGEQRLSTGLTIEIEDQMHHVLFAVYRKPELSFDDFVKHYREVHLPIARRLPKLRRYEIFPVLPAAEEGYDRRPDAFALMTFDSVEDFEAVLSSPEMDDAVQDNETFIDAFDTYTVDHLQVIPG